LQHALRGDHLSQLLIQTSVTRFAADFGRGLFQQCITTNVTYPDGAWQAELTLEDESTIKSIKLLDISEQQLYYLGGKLFSGNASAPASYVQRPEVACYAICRKQLGAECSIFTYDGITIDRYVPPSNMIQ
jgi:hypothetical protein